MGARRRGAPGKDRTAVRAAMATQGQPEYKEREVDRPGGRTALAPVRRARPAMGGDRAPPRGPNRSAVHGPVAEAPRPDGEEGRVERHRGPRAHAIARQARPAVEQHKQDAHGEDRAAVPRAMVPAVRRGGERGGRRPLRRVGAGLAEEGRRGRGSEARRARVDAADLSVHAREHGRVRQRRDGVVEARARRERQVGEGRRQGRRRNRRLAGRVAE
mmetsp:Transcript_5902/g.21532  ORF Transcript_5902/g.21532 Transcript_5902/m.21532 type:complete len:216 (-) Transcript_5902:372-1019(-)